VPSGDPVDLTALAEEARRYFKWAVFLLACGFVLTLVDLQLKKAVAAQAAHASELFAEVQGAAAGQGMAAGSRGAGDGGGGGDHRLVGDAPRPEEMDGAGDEGAASALGAPRRAAGGAPGDGQ
jgi:hypothetical protein